MQVKTRIFLGFVLAVLRALVCAGTVQAQQAGTLTLESVITQAAKAVEGGVPAGAKLAVLNFSSSSEVFSDYVIEELTGVLVMNRKVTVIERRSLDLVRKEMNLQLSGEVSDDSAQAIGKQLGAQVIVSGSLTNLGDVYRFRIKVINVETARIETQVSYNMGNDRQVTFLLNGSQGNAPPVAVTPAPNAGGTAPKPASAPAASGAQSQAGLYVGTAFQGAMDWYDILDWITLNAQNGGNYTIVLGKDQATSPTYLNYNNKRITITLKSAGGTRTVKFEGSSPGHSLFTVSAGVTFVLEEGITLSGAQNDTDKSLVRVDGGVFTMNGGTLTGNKTSSNQGGGVRVNTGTFTMNNGVISGNSGSGVYLASDTSIFTMTSGTISSNSGGGGVWMKSGTFTMNNGVISGNSAGNGGGVDVGNGKFIMNTGTISDNTASGRGGGVKVDFGTFTMNNGIISGNSASDRGGGVYVDGGTGTFTMNNGVISGNSASSGGGGVYVNMYSGNLGTFTKIGGIIYGSNAPDGQANRTKDDSVGHVVCITNGGYNVSKKRNTTARVTTAMDSKKDGPAGGWE